jgi:hypothetical protein
MPWRRCCARVAVVRESLLCASRCCARVAVVRGSPDPARRWTAGLSLHVPRESIPHAVSSETFSPNAIGVGAINAVATFTPTPMALGQNLKRLILDRVRYTAETFGRALRRSRETRAEQSPSPAAPARLRVKLTASFGADGKEKSTVNRSVFGGEMKRRVLTS